jgi:hypothetical protein
LLLLLGCAAAAAALLLVLACCRHLLLLLPWLMLPFPCLRLCHGLMLLWQTQPCQRPIGNTGQQTNNIQVLLLHKQQSEAHTPFTLGRYRQAA